MGFSQIIFSWTAIIPVIVLLYYFFRKNIQIKQFLRRFLVGDYAGNASIALFKAFTKNALLYLQLLALLLLVLALMNPYIKNQPLLVHKPYLL